MHHETFARPGGLAAAAALAAALIGGTLLTGCATPVMNEPVAALAAAPTLAETHFRVDLELRRQDAARFGHKIISVDADRWTITVNGIYNTSCVDPSDPTLNPSTVAKQKDLDNTFAAISLLNRGIAFHRQVNVVVQPYNGTCR